MAPSKKPRIREDHEHRGRHLLAGKFTGVDAVPLPVIMAACRQVARSGKVFHGDVAAWLVDTLLR